jgi:hypothetical protein
VFQKNAVYWLWSMWLLQELTFRRNVSPSSFQWKNQESGPKLAETSNRSTLLVFLGSIIQLLVTANVIPSSLILFTLLMEAILSSETWVPRRAKRPHIQESSIFHSHWRGNLKSYMNLFLSSGQLKKTPLVDPLERAELISSTDFAAWLITKNAANYSCNSCFW